MAPIVAIVGRPNVGKSTLFNKLIGQRRAIVDDTPGVTRDRIYGETEWCGRRLVLVDTGGIEPDTKDILLRQMRMQAEIAINTADAIIFLCDVRTGLVADDREIALMLKKSGKPVIPCVNKCDSTGTLPPEFYEFYELGFEHEPIPISSVHGIGSGDLLDKLLSVLPEHTDEEEDSDRIKVAVIGKPNTGKSSLVNKMTREERSIVSDIAGTTRDAIDTDFENKYGKFSLIDTAGIRRSARVKDVIEKYSVLRARTAVERADVCLIMIDATEGITEQDEKIAGIAHEAGKASLVVVNKWDIIEKDNNTAKKFTERVQAALSFMPYAPVIFVSAKTGLRVNRIFEQIVFVFSQACLRVPTGTLNEVLGDAIMRNQPPSDKGRRLKIYYMTQTGVKPPTFVIFCNSAELFHYSYRRYVENCLREAFGFSGTPIKLIIREKGDERP
ncbi:MAG: ribosome biogenesis GTPase Der [Eubacteriales bacterium]|jgi:GTP-binding protein